MQPANSQLFYYMLLIYAVGMVAYVALPIKPIVALAEAPASSVPQVAPSAKTVAANPAAATEMTARPVSLGDAHLGEALGSNSNAAPLLTAPVIESEPSSVSAKDAPQSL